MIKRPWTLTLTLLGRSPETHTVGRVRHSRRGEYARRATLVIRTGYDHGRLRQRLIDSISRLACGPVVGACSVADMILAELLDHGTPWRDRRCWTLTQIQGGSFADPYGRRASRLILVDPPQKTGRTRRRREPVHPPVLAQAKERICMS